MTDLRSIRNQWSFHCLYISQEREIWGRVFTVHERLCWYIKYYLYLLLISILELVLLARIGCKQFLAHPISQGVNVMQVLLSLPHSPMQIHQKTLHPSDIWEPGICSGSVLS